MEVGISSMSELRQDRTTGRWVVIAPQRGFRPGLQRRPTLSPADQQRARPAFDPQCPFCPGNEALLPGIVAETRTETPPNWAVRIVPNKYPALQADAKAETVSPDHRALDGYGFHEVIIEHTRHDADLSSMGDTEVAAVVAAYRDRSRHLMAQPGIEAVVVFRNHKPQGGASLNHPHAQIIALGLVPATVGMLADWGRRYHSEHARCPTCDEIAIERKLATRLVDETRNFIVSVPFAAEHPYETWIIPKQHQSSFVAIDDARLGEFAGLLRQTLDKLRRAQDNPPYNFVIDSADRGHLQSPFVHWRLRIVPALGRAGGFELGTGLAINSSRPEQDAAVLRDCRPDAGRFAHG
jgi:UDPglucose--hexose-1-phosphate uridylyltransferase